MNRVVITGLGWVTPMGHSIESVWKRLVAGESGISQTTIFDAATFPTSILGGGEGFTASPISSAILARTPARGGIRNLPWGLPQAWKAAGLDQSKLDLDRVGIYLGSGEGSLDFDAYTAAALTAWKTRPATIDW